MRKFYELKFLGLEQALNFLLLRRIRPFVQERHHTSSFVQYLLSTSSGPTARHSLLFWIRARLESLES